MDDMVRSLIVFAGIAVLAGVFIWAKRKDKPSGSGFIRPKPVPPFPVTVGWKVEHRAHLKGEVKRDSKGALIWYDAALTFKGSGPRVEKEAWAAAVEYSELWNVLTRTVPVYADEEG